MADPRVAVFVDYQNCYGIARETYCGGRDAPQNQGHFWPVNLAKELAVAGRRHYQLTFVGVYCGVADPRKAPRTAAARHNQIEAWKLSGAQVFTRQLRYPKNWPKVPAEEKGIDVKLALDLVTKAINRDFDVGIIASCDTDLAPAVEAVLGLPGSDVPEVEVMAWPGRSGKIGVPGRKLAVRQIGRNEFQQIQDLTDYNERVGSRSRSRPG